VNRIESAESPRAGGLFAETKERAGAAEEEALEGDTLSLLEKLQRVADELDRLEARRQEATEEKNRVEDNLHQAASDLAEKEKRAHALDIERRKRELSIKSEKERMQRVKGRLGDVKTSREYQAVLAEISSAKQSTAEQEDALLKEMEQLESLGAEVEEIRATVQGIREDLDEAGANLEVVLAETEQGIAERKSEEDVMLKSLPVEVVDRYRLIRARRGGLAVVEARGEACTACFMRIPPQTYIEVMRRTRVIQCPNCHRILIPPSSDGEQ
jgi:predicted  nucleic acid-binding Zn-ribbon protein